MPPPPPDGYSVGPASSFYDVVTAAVSDMLTHGFDSAGRLAYWAAEIRRAAIRSMTPPHVMERTLNDALRTIYRDKIDRGAILKFHPEVSRFTLQKVAPRLRDELSRRIMASAGLIKLNREQMVEETVRRFSGWGSSIPAGGSDVQSRREVKEQIRKPLASLPFRERRVLTDQSHKFVSSLNNVLAVDGGAIAAIWHSHAGELGYNARPNHAAREGTIFVVRDNWAMQRGLMKLGGAKYIDDIERPGELVYCWCWYTYLYSLRRLPEDMVTQKGREELARVKLAA